MAELEPLKFEIQDELLGGTRIKVVGVGGGGSNAVGRMIDAGVRGVEFFVMNTDAQALRSSPVPNKIALGARITHGLGAGSDPEIGRKAALEDTDRIIEVLESADMVFIAAGLGGGTGTGAAPVVASLAKELNALTVVVITKPFNFEGPRRRKQAEHGLAELATVVDTVITIPNDQLLDLVPKGTSFFESFRIADDVLRQAVQGIADIITTPGIINRDFSDIRSIMLGMGYAMMGTASAKGDNAAIEAARQAISCPLLEAGGVRGARGILINITGSGGLGLHEVNEACSLIREAAENEDVQINFGVVMNESMGDEVKITVIATGFERDSLPEIDRRAARRDVRPAPPPPPVVEAAPTPEFPAVFGTAAEPEPEFAPEPESEAEPAPAAAGLQPGPPPAVSAPQEAQEKELPLDDLDVPAFLRRERRLFQ